MFKKEKGVTLLELMVAVVITVLLGVALSAIFKTYSDAWQKGEARTQRYQNARLALEKMSSELRGTLLKNIGPGPATIKLVGHSDTYTYEGDTYDNDAVDFVTSIPRTASNNDDLDFVEIIYLLDTTDHELDRAREDYTAGEQSNGYWYPVTPYSDATLASKVLPVASHILGLSIKYWDGSAWQNVWTSTTALPKEIEIKVTVQSQLSRYKKTDTLSTRVVLPNG